MTIKINNEDENKSYDELSKEFRASYGRAYDLIPAMYIRLTSKGMSHKEASAKIWFDHRDLSGFSRRNIQRCLPMESPIVPRRVVPRRRKTSIAKLFTTEKLSNTQSGIGTGPAIMPENSTGCQNCLLLERKTEELEEALKAATNFTTVDIIKRCQSDKEFRFSLSILDIKKYLAYQQRVTGVNVSEIWIIAKIDFAKGIVISAIIDGLDSS